MPKRASMVNTPLTARLATLSQTSLSPLPATTSPLALRTTSWKSRDLAFLPSWALTSPSQPARSPSLVMPSSASGTPSTISATTPWVWPRLGKRCGRMPQAQIQCNKVTVVTLNFLVWRSVGHRHIATTRRVDMYIMKTTSSPKLVKQTIPNDQA